MIRVVLALLQLLLATLTRQARIRVGEGTDAAKPIGQLSGWMEYREFSQSVDLGSVATVTAENEDMAITGVRIGDMILFANPAEALVANIAVTALGPVLADNVVRFRVANPTAGAIDAAAVVFTVGVLRPL